VCLSVIDCVRVCMCACVRVTLVCFCVCMPVTVVCVCYYLMLLEDPLVTAIEGLKEAWLRVFVQ